MAETEQITLIHSLVPLSISEQWTRNRVQNKEAKLACGALLGIQMGRKIEIFNTFEVGIITNTNGLILIDEEYFSAREQLYKETFPNLEFLGFYITGDHATTDDQDVSIQRQAMKFNESPFLLKFNPALPVVYDKLSINVFDSIIDPSNENHLIFHPTLVKIVSELAEQIGLDHVARFSRVGNGSESVASKYLSAQLGAIATLTHGLRVARDYCLAVREGKLEANAEILGEINNLSQRLSVTKTRELLEKEKKQSTDHKLMLLLTSMTDTEGSMSKLISKLNILSHERGHHHVGPYSGRKHFGGGFWSRMLF